MNKPQPKPKSKTISVRLPVTYWEAVKQTAEARRIPQSLLHRHIFQDWMEKEGYATK